jgi:hypothetical protein
MRQGRLELRNEVEVQRYTVELSGVNGVMLLAQYRQHN